MTMREQFFECAFRSGQEQRTAVVRAWTATDARRMFLDLLAEEGIDADGGAVSVTPARLRDRVPVGITATSNVRHAPRP